jgi:outer membrane receptor for ferrienterochelin and colicin
VTPGVSSDAHPENTDQANITVYGSTGAENVYYIDGVNTTNMEYGFQGKQLNFEFIEEVDVKTGGYEAEYGKATGGVINVITKSGGNELHGDVFGYHDDDSLQNSSKELVGTTGRTTGFTKEDFGADLGGYILRDKLWFFAAYDRVDNSTDRVLDSGPQAGSGATSKSKRNLGAGKLTYRLSESQSLVLTYLQDPRVDTGAISDANHSLNGERSTYLGKFDFGG